jgi:hypothetical protein
VNPAKKMHAWLSLVLAVVISVACRASLTPSASEASSGCGTSCCCAGSEGCCASGGEIAEPCRCDHRAPLPPGSPAPQGPRLPDLAFARLALTASCAGEDDGDDRAFPAVSSERSRLHSSRPLHVVLRTLLI